MENEINFEQELYKHFGHVKDFTLCTAIAKRFFEMGREHQEPVGIKDKLRALSGGERDLSWLDDAKKVEIEECMMQFHEDIKNISPGTDSLTRIERANTILHCYSDKLLSMAKEEPVSNIWHDPDEEPYHNKPYAIKSSNGVVTASYTLFDNKGFTWTQIKEIDKISKWCYIDDLLKLSNVERTVKNWKEEIIVDNSEEAAKIHVESLDFSRSGCKESEFIVALKQVIIDSFVVGADWRRQQMMKNAVSGLVTESAGGDGWVNVQTGFVKSEDVNVKFGDKIKIIIIKTDEL